MDPTVAGHPLLLPEGTRLVHIGPPKTGTTTVQAALYSARPAMLVQGVRHAGRNRNAARPAQAVSGKPSSFMGGSVPPIREWHGLVREIRRAREARVVVSSEFFADASSEAIRVIARDIEPDRIHVAVTLRPLARILPSQWQQYVQDGTGMSFDAWLHAMLDGPGSSVTPSFWQRHDQGGLISRWADVVGPDRVTVIAVDDRDRGSVLRTFEQLLGLQAGTLEPQSDLENRSMTLPEIEAVRAFNRAFKARDLPKPLLSRVIHFGAARYMKRLEPDPDSPRLELPAWAIEPTGAIARQAVETIRSTGVRVTGDLAPLAEVPASTRAVDGGPVTVPPRAAAALAMGVLLATGQGRKGPRPDATELTGVPTRYLAGALGLRIQVAAGNRAHALRAGLTRRRGARPATAPGDVPGRGQVS
jgi:hypothetical protein